MSTPRRSVIGSLLPLALVALVVAACGQAAPSASSAPLGVADVTLTAGPVCPVEQNPPDPNCAPRPVADREILVVTADGREVARGRSDAQGRLRFTVPYGSYLLHAAAFEGFPSPPSDEPITVGAAPVAVSLDFDTGIR
jgi:hypothetical protein